MPKIVFVCTGNICRSPMAEYLLRSLLGEDSEWEIESAGILAPCGSPASDAAIHVMQEDEGIDIGPHRSRMLDSSLVAGSDLIVCMTPSHRAEILRSFPEADGKVFLLTDFELEHRARAVADPIGHSVDVYRKTKDQIKAALPDLVLHMKEM